MIHIRKAHINDIEDIININIETWKTAYEGIVAPLTLEKQDEGRENRIKRARDEFGTRNYDGRKIHQIVATDHDRVVGFATYGLARPFDKNPSDKTGEVYAIYVLHAFQGHDAGRLLLDYAFKSLKASYSVNNVIVWTLEDNKSRGFYDKMKGQVKYKKDIEIFGQILPEVGYVFELDSIISGQGGSNG